MYVCMYRLEVPGEESVLADVVHSAAQVAETKRRIYRQQLLHKGNL